ncbi:MAG: hypothetical protein E4H27_02600 [Anaerolineales bacterium]|nr:MAG: hypothetical protein E4H27_02600 [Anaerolineales bacterium]
MELSRYGEIANNYWQCTALNNARLVVPAWVVMPNHIHVVVIITEGEVFRNTIPSSVVKIESQYSPLADQHLRNAPPLQNAKSGSLGALIGNYKSVTTRLINQVRSTPKARVWQKNYYEHIIRNEKEYCHIIEYIESNPAIWEKDTYY